MIWRVLRGVRSPGGGTLVDPRGGSWVTIIYNACLLLACCLPITCPSFRRSIRGAVGVFGGLPRWLAVVRCGWLCLGCIAPFHKNTQCESPCLQGFALCSCRRPCLAQPERLQTRNVGHFVWLCSSSGCASCGALCVACGCCAWLCMVCGVRCAPSVLRLIRWG